MELTDIKSRDDLRLYWQQVINRPVWDAAQVEADRQSLLPVAKSLELIDWEHYLEAREGYDLDYTASAARLSAFMDWAIEHRESVEDWLFGSGLFSLGKMKRELARTDDALKIYDKLIDCFKQHSDKAIALTVAKALLNAANISNKSDNLNAACQYLKELRQLAKAHDEPAIREQLAKALFNAGVNAGHSGESRAMHQYLDELRKLAKAHGEPAIRERLAKILVNASSLAGNSSDSQAMGQYLDELRQLATVNDEPVIREKLAKALANAGYNARKSGESQQAKQYLDELRQLSTVHGELGIRIELARALFNSSIAATKSGDSGAVSQYLDELRQLSTVHDEPAIRRPLAKALVNAGLAASKSGDLGAESQYLVELRQLFKDHDEPGIREQLARALFNNTISLEKSKDLSGAFAACDEAEKLLQQLSDVTSKSLHEIVAIRKNRLRNVLGKPEEDLQEPQPGMHSLAGARSNSGPLAESLPAAPDHEVGLAAQAQSQTSDAMARARMIQALENVIGEFKEVKERFLCQMDRRGKRVDRFLDRKGRFTKDASVLMVLRQWNSYTPIIVDGQESDRGGGYFVRHKNVGLVIDPGYNFIELFHKAGCKIVDITHVAITHAHDDHTAQLEQLLTMFHQFHTRHKAAIELEKVTLILNHSTIKKFSGFSLHKDCPYIEKVICLNAFDADNEQTIKLTQAGDFSLTVLDAYHNDVFTTKYAIGLGLRIEYAKSVRRIVFTGDTGLYPPMLDNDGKSVFFDEYTDSRNRKVKERRVIEQEEGGINRGYPGEFQAPNVDLLVPHLGSIKEYEFNPPPFEPVFSDPATGDIQAGSLGPMFYPNHLGILGTAMLIKELQPRAVILSEFGSELRGLRMEIATLLRKALKKTVEEGNVPFIIPGDPSIVYNIADGHFLCHEDGCYHPHNEIEAKEIGGDRIGLFKKGGAFASLDRFDKYREDMVNSEKDDTEPFELPYMRNKG